MTNLTPIQYFVNSYAPPKQVSTIIEYGQQSVIVSAKGGDLAAVREACKAAKVGIVLGVSERVRGSHQLFNSLVFIDSTGTLLGRIGSCSLRMQSAMSGLKAPVIP